MISSGIIMTSGFGKRMMPLSAHMPKAILPVCLRPNALRIADSFYKAGINNIVVTSHYKAGDVIRIFDLGQRIASNINLYHHVENPLLDAGNSVKFIIHNLAKYFPKKKPFFVASGDISSSYIDLAKFIAAFKDELEKNSNLLGAICFILRPIKEIPNRYPTAIVDENNLMLSYIDSPQTLEETDQIFSKNSSRVVDYYSMELGFPVVPVDACFYILKHEIFSEVPPPLSPGVEYDFGKYIFRNVPPKKVFAYIYPEPINETPDKKKYISKGWINLNFPVDLWVAQFRYLLHVNKKLEFDMHGYMYNSENNYWFGKNSIIRGKVKDSLIGNGVEIRKGASVTRSIIGHRSKIREVDITDSLVLPFTLINWEVDCTPIEEISLSIVGGKIPTYISANKISPETKVIMQKVATSQDEADVITLTDLNLSEWNKLLPQAAFNR